MKLFESVVLGIGVIAFFLFILFNTPTKIRGVLKKVATYDVEVDRMWKSTETGIPLMVFPGASPDDSIIYYIEDSKNIKKRRAFRRIKEMDMDLKLVNGKFVEITKLLKED